MHILILSFLLSLFKYLLLLTLILLAGQVLIEFNTNILLIPIHHMLHLQVGSVAYTSIHAPPIRFHEVLQLFLRSPKDGIGCLAGLYFSLAFVIIISYFLLRLFNAANEIILEVLSCLLGEWYLLSCVKLNTYHNAIAEPISCTIEKASVDFMNQWRKVICLWQQSLFRISICRQKIGRQTSFGKLLKLFHVI